MKIGRFAFLRPPLGDLGATYDDHLTLIGKRVVDFLLALTLVPATLFYTRCQDPSGPIRGPAVFS